MSVYIYKTPSTEARKSDDYVGNYNRLIEVMSACGSVVLHRSIITYKSSTNPEETSSHYRSVQVNTAYTEIVFPAVPQTKAVTDSSYNIDNSVRRILLSREYDKAAIVGHLAVQLDNIPKQQMLVVHEVLDKSIIPDSVTDVLNDVFGE